MLSKVFKHADDRLDPLPRGRRRHIGWTQWKTEIISLYVIGRSMRRRRRDNRSIQYWRATRVRYVT